MNALGKKLNILMLSLYRVKSADDGYIAAALAAEFFKQGHNITVISPDESGSDSEISVGIETRSADGNVDKSNKAGGDFAESNNEAAQMTVINVATGPIQRTSSIKKLLNLRKLDKKTVKILKKRNEKYDLVICMVSHCAFFKAARYAKKRNGAFVYNMVKDIFPQNAVDLGMIKKGGLIYKRFKSKEDKYYRLSDCLGVISEAAKRFLVKENPWLAQEYASGNKIVEVNPNSIKVLPLNRPDNAEKPRLLSSYGIPVDKPVFVYGGNLGVPQGIDFVLECIEKNETRQNGNAFFLIVGGGTEYGRLERFFAQRQCVNSKLMPGLAPPDFEKLCACADVGLVFLNPKFTVPNYPSRVLSYMQAGLPVVFAVDRACDAGIIAEQNGFGKTCISGELQKFFSHIGALERDEALRQEMGNAAYEFLAGNYSVKNSADIILEAVKTGS